MKLPTLTISPAHHSQCCLSLSTVLLEKITELMCEVFSNSASSNTRRYTDFHPLLEVQPLRNPTTVYVFSIGSGTGLFEALLLQHWSTLPVDNNPEISSIDIIIEGVEVKQQPANNSKSHSPAAVVNHYLSEEATSTVYGTREISDRALTKAKVLMFVYPRDPELIRRYIEAFMVGKTSMPVVNGKLESGLQMLIWLGAKIDWEDFQLAFSQLEGTKSSSGSWQMEMFEGDEVGLATYEMMATFTLS